MTNEILQHVGSQIKMFRKIKKMTIDDLAKVISKSKSTVSKYESGEITVDIVTLFDIAKALNINIINLIDYDYGGNAEIEQVHIWQSNILHMYLQIGKNISSSVIHLKYDDTKKKTTATLYYKVDDNDDLKNCECVYQGYMSHHDNIINFNLKNCLYESESVLINFFVPMKKVDTLSGLISGLSADSIRPTSCKVILTKSPLPFEEQKELLQISKEAIKRLKTEHIFMVDD
ncbi:MULTISPECIES: helix-turn-helix domain-containing protein [unclassified Sedimentibacter]|uniref:helix-turn-helix domain-containing protein n=1 Tax=unclassified Sedimentibacter TaxID=2649220 RepID=UPI0027E03B4A|nr:helix-turn-helix transcriptional regulator [Sedimentibacter sp. MB35-C1]WMJ77271.1 helix-turn-helix transcriptional regulator [Sedimentibacter sp. MB35-C1]